MPPGLTPSYDIEYEGVWETTATTKDKLFDYEDEVHNYFLKYRMMREIPGDSEWFNFQGNNPYDIVKSFMDSRTWVKRQLSLSEIKPPKRSLRYLRKQYHKNLSYLKTREKRNTILGSLQEPIISNIRSFVFESESKAGYVIAPCGSGKTIMTVKGIRGIKKCVICCPSKQIQNQWKDSLVAESIFNEFQIYFIGGSGTTDIDEIRTLFAQERYCIISTYMSSHLLVDLMQQNTELWIGDEAHHMAGIVAKDETGEGRTRRLLLKATEIGIKRLSLTYTPRFIIDMRDSEKEKMDYLTMDDDAIFGPKIAELKIRDLIRKGVLPDYRLWTLRDEARKGTGIIGKADEIVATLDRIYQPGTTELAETLKLTNQAMDLVLAQPNGVTLEPIVEAHRLMRKSAQMVAVVKSVGSRGFEMKKLDDVQYFAVRKSLFVDL